MDQLHDTSDFPAESTPAEMFLREDPNGDVLLETTAMLGIAQTFLPMDDLQRLRVLRWAVHRYSVGTTDLFPIHD